MSERVALITGAGRGIGRATAIELARAGWRIGLIARTGKELREAQAACGTGDIFRCDVADERMVGDMIDAAVNRYGRVDALAHCAGLAIMKPLEKISAKEWQALIDVNLSSVYYLCHRLWPVWRKQGGGVVVNISSEASRDPFAGLGAYGAAKAGINLLGLALAREGKEIGVRVHTVAPAATETAMLRGIVSEEQVPKSAALQPEAVARVIVQCISGDLACTSGEVIYVHK
jgi:NAD(P)-dependent dehydrogenase (short-subunit alcohol dehydrogenase family)